MKIITKKNLADVHQGATITQMEISSPEIAKKALPGQFIALMVSEKGERIPLTIVEKTKDTITVIFQEAGLTTKLLGRLNAGDALYSLVGPLGRPTEIKNYTRVILVGGGVGIAEICPVAKALQEAGNHITTILGARTKDLLILEKELKDVSDEFYVTTDDGTYGKKGFVTDVLEELLSHKLSPPQISAGPPQAETINYKLIYAVGPIPMMQRVAAVTKKFNVKTLVSLNALMVDATGMCGCCRVTVGGTTRFSCVDGPEFDAHLVDWDELTKRNSIYLDKEKHICELYK